jgi:SAM-dependent methyltransferase
MSSLLLALVSAVLARSLQETPAPRPEPLAVLRDEAERVRGLVECRGTRSFLDAVDALPAPTARTLLYDAGSRSAFRAEEHARLAPEARARFVPSEFAPEFHYTTFSGSPLAYARVLDLVGRRSAAPDADALSGKRVLDFGYGGIGHLRLLASLGCDVVGVNVDSVLHAYYTADDQGVVAPASAGGKPGRLTLVHGRFPADERVVREIGAGFDLVLSKNTLKKGYVRPAQAVDARMLVDLGVSPEQFLPAVARVLAPGGLFAIYNVCPAPRADRYVPWAYGESPFTRAEFEAAGLELLAFDVEDHAAVRELAYALRWDEQGIEVEADTFAWYTLARRKG